MSSLRLIAATLAASSLSLAAARAAEPLRPATASITDLGGGASALTYWVNGTDGSDVVTTIDFTIPDADGHGRDHHAIVRFSAVLRPGQAEIVSVPAPEGAEAATLRISRTGDRIEVARSAGAQSAKLD